MAPPTRTRQALMLRPQHPGCLAILPRLQRRTARSFETEAPPDRLCVWLLDQGFKPLATPSGSAGEYGRVGRGRTDEDKPAELVVMFFSGSVLCQGRDAEKAAELLASIAEEAPATACMFDGLEGGAR